MIIVSDSSPIIALADAGYLELLREAFGEVIIPEAVMTEVFERRQRTKPSWIKIQTLDDAGALALYSNLRNTLDRGESEAIALAVSIGATVLIDERLGTDECSRRGIACKSTADALSELLATYAPKRSRLIVEDLRRYGIYVSLAS